MMRGTTPLGSRFRTGQRCPESGRYLFDGYMDGTHSPAPTFGEEQIPLSSGEVFPPIRSSRKPCWWKLAQRI